MTKGLALLSIAASLLPFVFMKKGRLTVSRPEPSPEPVKGTPPVLNDKGNPIKAYPIPPGYRRVTSFSEVPEDIRAEALNVLRSGAQLGETVPLREPYAAHIEEHSNAARGVSILVRV